MEVEQVEGEVGGVPCGRRGVEGRESGADAELNDDVTACYRIDSPPLQSLKSDLFGSN